MKTKIKQVMFLGICSIFFLSCSDFLSLAPESALTTDKFWKSEKDANAAISAIYNAFGKAMSSGVWDWGEIRADNFTYYEKDAADQQELINNEILIDNPAARWSNLYDVIGKANTAIRYIPYIKMSKATKDQFMAEAYALRAWAYFYCVRVWGDVPLFVEPVEDISQGIYRERTDKNDIIQNLILPDLEKAYYYSDKSATDRTRINTATICVLTMDAYAWIHDYEMVVKIKEERINGLDLSPDDNAANKWEYLVRGDILNWRNLFVDCAAGDIPNEVWFKIAYDRYGNGTNNSLNYFAKSSSKLIVTSSLISVYGSSDNRQGGSQWATSNSERRLTRKFWPTGTSFSGDGAVVGDNDIVLYRYADVTLLYAEALNELGRYDEAIVELNKTLTRAGNTAKTGAVLNSYSKIADAILLERRCEFVGEGKRWFDLVRTNKWAQFSKNTDPEKLFFPVHRDHLLQNPKLTQNTGYPYP